MAESGSERDPGLEVVRVDGRRSLELARRLSVLTASVADEAAAIRFLGVERSGGHVRQSCALFGCRRDPLGRVHGDRQRLGLNDDDSGVQGVDRGLGQLVERGIEAARIPGIVCPVDLARGDNDAGCRVDEPGADAEAITPFDVRAEHHALGPQQSPHVDGLGWIDEVRLVQLLFLEKLVEPVALDELEDLDTLKLRRQRLRDGGTECLHGGVLRRVGEVQHGDATRLGLRH
jgi:hypothetical protein